MEIDTRLLKPEAALPDRANPGDAGADLVSAEAVTIPPGERRDIGTGLAIAIPSGYGGFVLPRSGLAFKHGIMLVNAPGLIDSGYRGEIRVCLYNSGHTPFVIEPGERIAQIVVIRVEQPTFITVSELSETARGAGGFGSSGR